MQILERKNNEIEELKTLYKKKQNETEETIRKLEMKGDVLLLHKSFNNTSILFEWLYKVKFSFWPFVVWDVGFHQWVCLCELAYEWGRSVCVCVLVAAVVVGLVKELEESVTVTSSQLFLVIGLP